MFTPAFLASETLLWVTLPVPAFVFVKGAGDALPPDGTRRATSPLCVGKSALRRPTGCKTVAIAVEDPDETGLDSQDKPGSVKSVSRGPHDASRDPRPRRAATAVAPERRLSGWDAVLSSRVTGAVPRFVYHRCRGRALACVRLRRRVRGSTAGSATLVPVPTLFFGPRACRTGRSVLADTGELATYYYGTGTTRSRGPHPTAYRYTADRPLVLQQSDRPTTEVEYVTGTRSEYRRSAGTLTTKRRHRTNRGCHVWWACYGQMDCYRQWMGGSVFPAAAGRRACIMDPNLLPVNDQAGLAFDREPRRESTPDGRQTERAAVPPLPLLLEPPLDLRRTFMVGETTVGLLGQARHGSTSCQETASTTYGMG